VSFWIEHLKQVQSNRKRGAAKAAATRKLKRQQPAESTEAIEDSVSELEAVFCGVCGELYEDTTDEVEN